MKEAVSAACHVRRVSFRSTEQGLFCTKTVNNDMAYSGTTKKFQTPQDTSVKYPGTNVLLGPSANQESRVMFRK